MTIKGDCIWQGQCLRVSVSRLDASGCEMVLEIDTIPGECELALWLGAIGPLPARATWRDSSHLTARFEEPLDERILEHFEAA